MGRKGVSKRKPKQSNTGSNDNNNHGSSNARPGQSSASVQSLVNARNAPLTRGDANSSNGSTKKTRKGG
jgi:hypothetical protein